MVERSKQTHKQTNKQTNKKSNASERKKERERERERERKNNRGRVEYFIPACDYGIPVPLGASLKTFSCYSVPSLALRLECSLSRDHPVGNQNK